MEALATFINILIALVAIVGAALVIPMVIEIVKDSRGEND